MITLEKTKQGIIEFIKNLKVCEDLPKYHGTTFSIGETLHSSDGFCIVTEAVRDGGDVGICKITEVYGLVKSFLNVGDIITVEINNSYSNTMCRYVHTDGTSLGCSYFFPTKESAENAEEIIHNIKLLWNLFYDLDRTSIDFPSNLIPLIIYL